MIDVYLVIDLTVVIALFVLALTVFLKNSTLQLNRIFSAFVLCVGVWIMSNYISSDLDRSVRTATGANYFVFAFSFLSAVFLLRFSIALSNDKKASKAFRVFIIPVLIITSFCFTPLLVKGVHEQGQVYAVNFGPFLPIYGAALAAVLTATFYVINKNLRTASEAQKGRLGVLRRSLIYALPLLLVTEFILPAATGWFGLTNLGILSMLILVVGLYIGVIKHKLFDLKLIVARSLAYALSLGTLIILFVVVAFALTGIIFRGINLNATKLEVIYGFLTIILAITYGPLKKFFDRATSSIFFRDAYDSQEFLDQLNKVLVSTFELQQLLNKSSQVIEANLKPQYCMFGVKETDYAPRRMFGSTKLLNFDESDIAYVRSLTPKFKRKVIVTDLIEPKYEKLQKTLQDNNISMIARLAANTNEEGIGYLIFGPKKSGNVYSEQDVRIIEIIANELVLAIQNALRFEEIQQFNITLQEKVNEATRKLRRSNEKLKQMDETKDDFISMASHQLRTPLTSVKGYISMVLEEDAGKITATQRDMLGQAFFSSQRMVYLIADLLNVSRLKTGKFIIERAPIQLDQIVQQELRQLQETAAARSLTLQFDKPETFPSMMLDETKTRQIIMNFIDNAIYYTPAGGHIIVQLVNKERSVELRVKDNGIGVPKNEQQHLFTKFYRAGNARQARPDGTGLGLYMAKKVIVAQGGSLIFDSEEGKGSTFGFVFSKSLAATPDLLAPVVELPVQSPAKELVSSK